MRHAISKVGLLLGGGFIALAVIAWIRDIYSSVNNTANSGETGIVMLLFTFPWFALVEARSETVMWIMVGSNALLSTSLEHWLAGLLAASSVYSDRVHVTKARSSSPKERAPQSESGALRNCTRHGEPDAWCLTPPSSGQPQAGFAHLRLPLMSTTRASLGRSLTREIQLTGRLRYHPRPTKEFYQMITCHLRYVLDPTKLKEFEYYGKVWIPLVKKFGGVHHGYLLPSEMQQYRPGILLVPIPRCL